MSHGFRLQDTLFCGMGKSVRKHGGRLELDAGAVYADRVQTYKIGEAAELLALKTYVLRFWESEFPELAPIRTPKGQRLYAEEHIELLRTIKRLLHEQGMTIDGARRVLAAERAKERANERAAEPVAAPSNAETPSPAVPEFVLAELREIRRLLASKKPA